MSDWFMVWKSFSNKNRNNIYGQLFLDKNNGNKNTELLPWLLVARIDRSDLKKSKQVIQGNKTTNLDQEIPCKSPLMP